jgi:hypothetical protein
MELYRLFKDKCFYVILLIIAFIAWSNVFYISKGLNTLDGRGWLSDEPRHTWDLLDSPHLLLGPNYDIGLLVNGTNTVTAFDEVSVLLSSSFVLLCTGVFTILFALSDTSSGFIKNIASCIKKRRFIIISKMIALSVFILMEFAALLLVTELVSLIYIKHLSHGVSLEQLRYIGLQFLLYIAYADFILLVMTSLKNAPISIILHIFFCWNSGTLINYFIFNYCALFLKSSFPLSFLNYYLVPNIVLLSVNSPYRICIRAFLVSIAAILFYSMLNIVVIEERDI